MLIDAPAVEAEEKKPEAKKAPATPASDKKAAKKATKKADVSAAWET